VYETGTGCRVSVQIEPDSAIASEGDQARVAAEVSEDLKRSLGVRLECEVVAPGSLSKHHDAGRRARRLSRQ
jgi:phenylacetate-coenzyme A ligase PaaK-like adenylate-forming protein